MGYRQRVCFSSRVSGTERLQCTTTPSRRRTVSPGVRPPVKSIRRKRGGGCRTARTLGSAMAGAGPV